jgi:hypothetical protein
MQHATLFRSFALLGLLLLASTSTASVPDDPAKRAAARERKTHSRTRAAKRNRRGVAGSAGLNRVRVP